MQNTSSDTTRQPLYWFDIGEVPAEVKAWQANRMKKAQSIGGVGGAFLFGGLAGFASNAIVSSSGSFAWDLPLFFAVAIPVGVGEFLFMRWFIPRIARATQYQVRRVAISAESLQLERASGEVVAWPVKSVRVSTESPAGGWYVVSIPAGRTSLSFWAPPTVASSIRVALHK